MSELTAYSVTNYAKAVRPVGAKLNDVFVVMPENIKIQDATASAANSFDEILNAGYPDPDAAPTLSLIAGGLTGTYAYYFAFYNQNRDSEGPSVKTSDASPSGQGIRVTRADTNAPADATHWRVYRNQDGGAIYYRVTTETIATTTYDDTATDAAIAANDPLDLDNDRPESMGMVHSHKGYMFGGGAVNHSGTGVTRKTLVSEWDDQLTWSKLNNCNAWPTVNQTMVEPGRFGILRALESMGDTLMVYKDEATLRWSWSLFPSGVPGLGDGEIVPVNYHRGALNNRCVADIEGKHYCMDQKGIWINSGSSNYTDLTDPIRPIWERINWAAAPWFSVAWQDDRIWFFVALDTDTLPHHALVYDLQAERSQRGLRWSLDYYDFAVVDSTRYWFGNTTAAGTFLSKRKWATVAMDDYGNPHVLNYGFRDGVHPFLDCSGTIDSSTTTTITDSSQTWSLTNENGETVDVKGLYVRFTGPNAIGEYAGAHRITGISGGQLTLGTTFSVAPPTSMGFWVGPIPQAEYRTPYLDLGDMAMRKDFIKFHLEYEPRGVDFKLRVSFGKDRCAVEGVSKTDTDESGWEATAGNDYIDIDMGGDRDTEGRLGYRAVQIMGESGNLLQAVFKAEGCDLPATIHAFGVEPGVSV